MADKVVDHTPMTTAGGGPGLATTWLCMGCKLPKRTSGSRGKGLAKRCAQCVEAADSASPLLTGRMRAFVEALEKAGAAGLDLPGLMEALGCRKPAVEAAAHRLRVLGVRLHAAKNPSKAGRGGLGNRWFATAELRDAYAAQRQADADAKAQARAAERERRRAAPKPQPPAKKAPVSKLKPDGIVAAALQRRTGLDAVFFPGPATSKGE